MKTLKLFVLPVFGSLEFGWQVIRYALILVSAFPRQRASLGCEIVAREVSSASTKKLSEGRDCPALAFTRRVASCGFCCQRCGPDGSLRLKEFTGNQLKKGLRLLEAGSPAKRHVVTQDTERQPQNWTHLRFFGWTMPKLFVKINARIAAESQGRAAPPEMKRLFSRS
jgi:hypothetical protein